MISPISRQQFTRRVTFPIGRNIFPGAAQQSVQQLQHPHGTWTLDGYTSDTLFLRLVTDPAILEIYPYLPQHMDQQFDFAADDQSITLSLATYSPEATATFDAFAAALNSLIDANKHKVDTNGA